MFVLLLCLVCDTVINEIKIIKVNQHTIKLRNVSSAGPHTNRHLFARPLICAFSRASFIACNTTILINKISE
jgi:hypothetical protein